MLFLGISVFLASIALLVYAQTKKATEREWVRQHEDVSSLYGQVKDLQILLWRASFGEKVDPSLQRELEEKERRLKTRERMLFEFEKQHYGIARAELLQSGRQNPDGLTVKQQAEEIDYLLNQIDSLEKK